MTGPEDPDILMTECSDREGMTMEMWFSEFHTPDVKHSIRVNRQLYSRQSEYQRIDIFETPEFGRVLNSGWKCNADRA